MVTPQDYRVGDADLCDGVRRHCAAVAAGAQLVRIAVDAAPYAGGTAGLDPGVHLLDAPTEERARYVLVLDAINFGSGWFADLDPASLGGEDATTAFGRRLTEHARARGEPWSGPELRALDAAQVARVLDQDPAHELMRLYARSLRDLGAWLGSRAALEAIAAAARGSAARLAARLAAGMPLLRDAGLYKRAQITVNDLVLAGVADLADVDALTVFADDRLPHVLRVDGVLTYAAALAARVDAGEPLEHGSREEHELRACAVHACELIAARLGVAPRTLDNWLWNRGGRPPYTASPPHRTRTTAY